MTWWQIKALREWEAWHERRETELWHRLLGHTDEPSMRVDCPDRRAAMCRVRYHGKQRYAIKRALGV